MNGWLLAVLIPNLVVAQVTGNLTLEDAYSLAEKNYPLVKQRDLVRQTADLISGNLSKSYLPQFSVSGQLTYQSDVTKVDVPLPGFKIAAPQKDQYKIVAEVIQLVFDGGVIRQQKKLQELNQDVEQQKVEVELHKLKERINQLFLGTLFLNEQLKQADLVKQDIQTGIRRVEAQVNNGVAFKSNLNVLKAELLKAGQRTIELKASRKGLLETLSLFLNQPVNEDVQFEPPATLAAVTLISAMKRPEINLYNKQVGWLEQQNKLIRSKNLPKASLFVQGGYGRPGLNLLDNQFDFYYIGGVQLNWSLGGFYTQKKEKQLVKINQQTVNTQKDAFLLNTNAELRQQLSEIDKWDRLIVSDNEIIELRKMITEAAKAQLENGVITANDYLKEVNAEDQARQSLISHELQLMQARINYQTISGN